MSSNNEKLFQLSIFIKQCLNEFDKIDKLTKKVGNDNNDLQKWIPKHKNLNFDRTLDDMKLLSPVIWMWEGNTHDKNTHSDVQARICKEEVKFWTIINL